MIKDNDNIQENETKDVQKNSYKNDFKNEKNSKEQVYIKNRNSISNMSTAKIVEKIGMHNFVAVYEKQMTKNKKISQMYKNNIEKPLPNHLDENLYYENLITKIPSEINNLCDYDGLSNVSK